MARRILWGSLVLTPIAILARYVFHLDETTLFVLAAVALIPLAWLIGESTEHAAEHTGPGVGGLLNASFGNAPELIIALFAVFGAVALIAIPSALAWGGGSHERHSLYLVSLPISAVLLLAYLVITWQNLRIHRAAHREEPAESAWSLKRSLVALGLATAATAIVSEILVHSLDHFGKAVGLNEFFIAVVIVAIVGNAAEHGGAVVIARRGNTRLATEIAITSSMQVAVFVTPAVCLLSWIVGRGLPLSFRVIEIVTMAAAALFAAVVVADGRSRRWEGFLLVAVYGGAVVWYLLA